MDDETFLVDVKVGNDADKTSIAAERFKLVSGHEINLKGHAKVVEKLAQADPSSTVYFSISIPKSAKIIQSEFEAEVEQSLALTPDERRKRLDSATKIPPQRQVVAIVFRRNADVVAFVLDRAKGHCELCGTSAPFVKAKDQQPYLEVHHKVTLAEGGEDTVSNTTVSQSKLRFEPPPKPTVRRRAAFRRVRLTPHAPFGDYDSTARRRIAILRAFCPSGIALRETFSVKPNGPEPQLA
jgi:hypothetical protein